MKVNSAGNMVGPAEAREAKPVLPESRLGIQKADSVADPAFDDFYNAFMSWAAGGVGNADIKNFIKTYVSDSGEPLFHSNKEQAAALASVLSRMKESQLEDDALYSDVKRAFVSMSATNMFIDSFMSDIFFPPEDEESRENMEW
ncbi:hypothetical protein SAMN05660489_05835 [Pseudomonas sp. LAMO17WK12:I10]|uniref:hypothetical protein n=1 Tax=unclassified Pseudomonas TaxID=196821 RepID=UPI000BC5B86A|nr:MULTISPECIES: hypothetical protein [unclassified Pseudomonas]PXX54005.1 hypothetical protein H160_05828 [Pseudomonas sp. LAMO17WK12:I9]SNY51942.1 hypothetical protein SAMN05660489_05835 [Pseudomonas sp. LAMO17WK12:I10]